MTRKVLAGSLAALATTLFLSACVDRLSPTEPPVDPHPPGIHPDSVSLWSDPTSWPDGKAPGKGADVVIPEGRRILLDESTPELGSIKISGELVFGARDVALRARRIMVHGVLRAGSRDQRHTAEATIVLGGGADGGLMVMSGGALELHGEDRLSWTRLAETAPAGSSTLLLEEAANWREGDVIVLAPSSHEPAEFDVMRVRSVAGREVSLEGGLKYRHDVVEYHGPTISYTRAPEVGLLTRNIVIRSKDLSPGDGMHVMVMAGGTAHIDGVLFRGLGVPRTIAKYPMHWHLVGRADGDYLRNSSIWKSGNRCMTVHGTHGVEVSNNVCFDHHGHGVFLEDGIETDNKIHRNLVIFSKGSAGPLPTDGFPGAFWITNPDNSFVGNVAAGTLGHAFWFAMPEHPTGLSTTNSVWPRRTPLGKFQGNVAHSVLGDGLFIDGGQRPDGTAEIYSYEPRSNPGVPTSPTVPAKFEDFVGYRIQGNGMWARGVDLHIVGGVFAEGPIGADFAAFDVSVEKTLFVGRPAGTPPLPKPKIPVRGFEFYDGPVRLRNVEFADFDGGVGRPAGAISFKIDNVFPVDVDNSVEGVRFVRSNPVLLDDPDPANDGDMGTLIHDLDGSLTGQANTFVVAKNPFMLTSSCRLVSQWNGHVCEGRYGRMQIFHSSATRVDVTRDDTGSMVSPRGVGEPSAAYGLGSVTYPAGIPLRMKFNASGEATVRFHKYAPPVIRMQSSKRPSSVKANFSRVYAEATSLAEFDEASAETFFWDAGNGVIYIKPTQINGGTVYLTVAPAH